MQEAKVSDALVVPITPEYPLFYTVDLHTANEMLDTVQTMQNDEHVAYI